MTILMGTLEEVKDKLDKQFGKHEGNICITGIWTDEDVRNVITNSPRDEDNDYFSNMSKEEQDEYIEDTMEKLCLDDTLGESSTEFILDILDQARFESERGK